MGVYPRVCGGTVRGEGVGRLAPGLSPRVRGNPGLAGEDRECAGSIPACAGEPRVWYRWRLLSRVYPRVCGGTTNATDVRRLEMGLSPRVRGNQRVTLGESLIFGSIPACAGEPSPQDRVKTWEGVYPRVCGGTCTSNALTVDARGLSPRVRGTSGLLMAPHPQGGLSPRVRGNRRLDGFTHHLEGSIPACAGEPPPRWFHPSSRRVYPRVCGGTVTIFGQGRWVGGLSPRVRGNRDQIQAAGYRAGSIPACAGEPLVV